MISNQEEDEFVAVRVQDPRIQNEGSWNSYVDYKIFLHTNSKAFTAKTSCVRRRYSEFAWLRKKLQKNAGLVPVPDLPGKSFFSFSNEDFLEGRRKGLQVFLDKVVHMTVCLSDSQLHLFLQTQLPVGHIQDCVQGHTPYTVTDAILTYASSNRGLAQAQEEDTIKEPSLTVSYESMESPAPHQPVTQTADTCSPELLSCSQADPLEGLLESCDKDTAELHLKDKPSIKVLQKNNHLEAVVEDCNPGEASFFVGDSPPDLSQARSCVIQTPVEVHLPRRGGFEEESCETLQTEEKTPDAEEQEQLESVGDLEPEKCENSGAVLDLKDIDAESQEVALGVCSEKPVLENHALSEDNSDESVVGTKDLALDVTSQEELQSSDEQKEAEDTKSGTQELQEVMPLDVEIKEARLSEENGNKDRDAGETGQASLEQESDLDGTKGESDKESHLMQLSNGSIVQTGDGPQESSEEDDGSEELVLENPVSAEDINIENVDGTEGQVVQCQEESESSCSQSELQVQEQQEEKGDEDGDEEQTDQEKDGQRVSLVGTKDESDEERRSLPSPTAEVEDGSQEGSCSEKLLQENHVISVENVKFVGTTNVGTVTSHEGAPSSDRQEEPEKDKRPEATPHKSENHKDTPEEDSDDEQMDQGKVELEVDFVGTKGESDEDSHSLPSSNGSIVKVSDEESGCDEAQEENGFMKTLREDGTDWSEEEPSSGHILDLRLNGGRVEKDEDLQYTTDIDFNRSVELNSAVTDQTENSDFSVIETSCSPVLNDRKCAEQEDVDVSEEAHEVEVHQLSS